MHGANKPQKPQAAKKTTGQLPNATIRSLSQKVIHMERESTDIW